MRKFTKRDIISCLLFIVIFGSLIFILSELRVAGSADLPDSHLQQDTVSSYDFNDDGGSQNSNETDTVISADDVFERMDNAGLSKSDFGLLQDGQESTDENAVSRLSEDDGRSYDTAGAQGLLHQGLQETDVTSDAQKVDSISANRFVVGGYNPSAGKALLTQAGLQQIGVKTFCKVYTKFITTNIGQKIVQKGMAPFLITLACMGINTAGLEITPAAQEMMITQESAIASEVSNAVGMISADECAYIVSSRAAANAAQGVKVSIPDFTQQCISDTQTVIQTGELPSASASTWEQAVLQLCTDGGVIDTSFLPGLSNTCAWWADMLGANVNPMDGSGVTSDKTNLSVGDVAFNSTNDCYFTNAPEGKTVDDWVFEIKSSPNDSGKAKGYEVSRFVYWYKSDTDVVTVRFNSDKTSIFVDFTNEILGYSHSLDGLGDPTFSNNTNNGVIVYINGYHSKNWNPAEYYFNSNFHGHMIVEDNNNTTIAEFSNGQWTGDYKIEGEVSQDLYDKDISYIGDDASFDGDSGGLTDPGTVDVTPIVEGNYNPSNYGDVQSQLGIHPVENPQPSAENPNPTITSDTPVYDPTAPSGEAAKTIKNVLPSPDPNPVVDPTPAKAPSKEPAKYTNIGDLTKVFPFCIPWDLLYLINMLAAQPVAPSFDWTFDFSAVNAGVGTLHIDLSGWDSVALILRKAEDVLFMVGLAILTRNLLRG
jgi:hypothetical protein